MDISINFIFFLLFFFTLIVTAGVRKENSRVRVDCWWRKSSIPEKFRTHGPGGAREHERKIEEEEEKNVE